MSPQPLKPDDVIGICDTILQWYSEDGELVSLDVGHGIAHTQWGIRHFEHATGVTTTVDQLYDEDSARRRLSTLRTLYIDKLANWTFELVRREVIYGPWQNEAEHGAVYADPDDEDDEVSATSEATS